MFFFGRLFAEQTDDDDPGWYSHTKAGIPKKMDNSKYLAVVHVAERTFSDLFSAQRLLKVTQKFSFFQKSPSSKKSLFLYVPLNFYMNLFRVCAMVFLERKTCSIVRFLFESFRGARASCAGPFEGALREKEKERARKTTTIIIMR